MALWLCVAQAIQSVAAGSSSPRPVGEEGLFTVRAKNRGSCVTFNHASGACLMISISVENNSNKCQMQGPTQSPGRGAHSHIGPQ